jgi:hypothetical protein
MDIKEAPLIKKLMERKRKSMPDPEYGRKCVCPES